MTTPPYDPAAVEAVLARADDERAAIEAALERSREVALRAVLATILDDWDEDRQKDGLLSLIRSLTADADRAGYERGRREALEEADARLREIASGQIARTAPHYRLAAAEVRALAQEPRP